MGQIRLSRELVINEGTDPDRAKKLGKAHRQFQGKYTYHIELDGGVRYEISKDYYEKKKRELHNDSRS